VIAVAAISTAEGAACRESIAAFVAIERPIGARHPAAAKQARRFGSTVLPEVHHSKGAV
jgi:hypothetical protein